MIKGTGNNLLEQCLYDNGQINLAGSNKNISRIEFVPAIYPRQIEVGKIYVGKNEIIERIVESERMVHIYTLTSGIKYGTPICITKNDVERVIYQ